MSVSCDVIKNLDGLFSNYLGNTKIIKNIDLRRLSQPGENYGSVVFYLDVTVQNKADKTEEVLHTIAKILPEGEGAREMFQIQKAFNAEVEFYDSIIPALHDFQQKLGIKKPIGDYFAKKYAIRRNLTGVPNFIDDDFVMILENLFKTGYVATPKAVGFNKNEAEKILIMLAEFHGTTLAYKVKHPNEYQKIVRANCYKMKEDSIFMPMLVKLVLDDNEETKEIMKRNEGWLEAKRPDPREPFATLVHDDTWPSNIMLKFEDGNPDPVGIKLIDFQVFTYGSPALDMFFFLWTSVPLEILKTHLDYFIKLYHDNLISTLKEHGIDTAPFSFDAFQEEIKYIQPFQFLHTCLFYVGVVNGIKGGIDLNNMPAPEHVFKQIPSHVKEKAFYMAKECHRRKWLK